MSGRIRRLRVSAQLQNLPVPAPLVCALCGRPIPHAQKDEHHLVPKSKGGRHTTSLHRICHRQIHALLTETELAREFSTVQALLAHPEIERFVAWVKTKPVDFMERSRKSQRLRDRSE
ncbi:MAG: HNH endonuclease [Burkholderiaceae bacterium]